MKIDRVLPSRPRVRGRSRGWIAVGLLVALAGCAAPGSGQHSSAGPAYDKALHDALPAAVRHAGVLRVATDASYAPASSFAPNGRTIIGFEPDLGAALGRVLGVKVVFTNHDFATLTHLVNRRGTDIVMSAMTDTAGRERQVDFVDYFSAGTSIVVQRGNPAGINDLSNLCGHRVAVEDGTVQVDLLARARRNCDHAPITVRTYPTNADALVQLRTGRVAAVLNDYPQAVELATSPATRSHFQLASKTQYEPGLYGIAVAKDQPGLRSAVRQALNRIIRDGTYRRVLHRWNVTEGAVRSATINGGPSSSAT